jgi:hypothetical protein
MTESGQSGGATLASVDWYVRVVRRSILSQQIWTVHSGFSFFLCLGYCS